MSSTENYPVLAYIVKTLQTAIADSKVETLSPSEFKIKDGNDEIQLQQEATKEGSGATILITDKRRIIFSEDLLETLQDLHENVKGNANLKKDLEEASIIINGLNIETEFILQAIKDFLDQVSNSYEFIQTVENDVTKIGAGFKFGKHIFRLNINNEPEKISIEPRFTASFEPNIQKTIVEDIKKVESAVNKMFKAD